MRFFDIAAPATLCAAFLSGVTLLATPNAFAGEILDAPEGAKIYVFKECAAPEPFVIEEKDVERFDRRPRSHRRAMRRYDVYVAALNAYFECMQDEAQTDLDAVFSAVDGELQARQNEALGQVAILRGQLKLDEKDAPQPKTPQDEQLEEELLGAE